MPIKSFSLTGIMIYDNKVVTIMANPESPLAIFIESEDIAQQYKDSFEVLWKIAKK